MFFEFFKKEQAEPVLAPRLGNEKKIHFSRLTSLTETKTLLIGAGFFVLASFAGFSFWFYFNFLEKDNFLESVPREAVVYWQSDFSSGADDAWLWAITRSTLSGEAAEQTKFLEEVVTPEVERVGFAILPDFADFIFLGQADNQNFDSLKNKLEELNYHYIFRDDGRVIISNSRFGLGEVVAALSQEKKSLADDEMRLVAFKRAQRHSLAQIYFGENFKVQDFRAMLWFSDFWSSNKLVVVPKGRIESPRNLVDFNFLSISDDKYLKNSMEEIIKDDLAVLLPEIQEKTLSDGTKVKELFANPDIFVFQDEQIGGVPVHYLSVGALNQEFLVGRKDQKVMISNSTEIFQYFLSNARHRPDYYGKSLGELILSWLKWVTPDFSGIIFEVSPSVGDKASL
ncbi:hypothetical protein KKD80_01570 [Patescibacteria group bacterium]|nr:hypothetical protein [Patescibacteria group bacterium]